MFSRQWQVLSFLLALRFCLLFIMAFYNGFLGIRLLSVWHGSICVFYLLLVSIRGMILLTERKNRTRSGRERAFRRCRTFRVSSFMLFVLNLALLFPISQMALFEKPVNMGLIPAIAMAAYTTYKLTMSSIHIQKQKRNSRNNIFVAELRMINFIDALVSILTLQNTLIMVNQTKSSMDDMILLSVVSSAVIYMVMVFMTVRLLIRGFG